MTTSRRYAVAPVTRPGKFSPSDTRHTARRGEVTPSPFLPPLGPANGAATSRRVPAPGPRRPEGFLPGARTAAGTRSGEVTHTEKKMTQTTPPDALEMARTLEDQADGLRRLAGVNTVGQRATLVAVCALEHELPVTTVSMILGAWDDLRRTPWTAAEFADIHADVVADARLTVKAVQ